MTVGGYGFSLVLFLKGTIFNNFPSTKKTHGTTCLILLGKMNGFYCSLIQSGHSCFRFKSTLIKLLVVIGDDGDQTPTLH